ncbi:MAG: aspartyl/asparaginyl beta-hydroxylase domain-containing protein [Flavobacteriaceae bacterium]|nr:aspartyl/asparaginyl beta-hydroxylase domain-containing protein [Flavobacteriaceae bacterium]
MKTRNALKLNFQFDAQRIRKELESISDSFYPILSAQIEDEALEGMHLIAPDREGKVDERGHTFHMSEELKKCPYLQEILDTFQCDKFLYRTQNLKPGGKIEMHRDRGRGIVDGIVRLNIPVSTNDQVYFYIDGERIAMKDGECWLPEVTKLHEVENRSDELRMQIMIDCDLNDWWKDVLKEHGMIKEPAKYGRYSLRELQAMKDSFVSMKMDRKMIEELEFEIVARAEV